MAMDARTPLVASVVLPPRTPVNIGAVVIAIIIIEPIARIAAAYAAFVSRVPVPSILAILSAGPMASVDFYDLRLPGSLV